MTIYLLSKYNPFAVPSASSNRYIGLLKGLSHLGYDITVLITGGYYNQEEKKVYGKKGEIYALKYQYLSNYANTSLNRRRIYEYFLKPFLFKFLAQKFKALTNQINQNHIVWIRTDIINFKLVNSIEKKLNQSYFMEINEFPDIHLNNNSTRFFWQKSSATLSHDYFNKNILPNLDGLALMTKTLYDYFEPKCSPKTQMLHLPMTVDLDRFNLNLNHDRLNSTNETYIAFLGSMNDTKDGVNILIESFINIASKHPTVQLCLFGFWAYDTQKHLDLIENSGLEHRILYSKAIDSSEVINVLMNATLLVLPRPDSYQAQGGFPTKLGEYLATTKPVIATTVGEIPNYLKDRESVFFCKPGDVESLKETLDYALSNPELATKIGIEGRKVAETVFSTNVQSQRLNLFLHSL